MSIATCAQLMGTEPAAEWVPSSRPPESSLNFFSPIPSHKHTRRTRGGGWKQDRPRLSTPCGVVRYGPNSPSRGPVDHDQIAGRRTTTARSVIPARQIYAQFPYFLFSLLSPFPRLQPIIPKEKKTIRFHHHQTKQRKRRKK